MKMCERCHEKPVANPHGKYCESCRDVAKAEARARAKALQPLRDAKYLAKKKAKTRTEEVNQRTGLGDTKKQEVGCPGCYYYRLFYAGMSACHYCIDTGKVRPVPPEECYRHDGTPYLPEEEAK